MLPKHYLSIISRIWFLWLGMLGVGVIGNLVLDYWMEKLWSITGRVCVLILTVGLSVTDGTSQFSRWTLSSILVGRLPASGHVKPWSIAGRVCVNLNNGPFSIKQNQLVQTPNPPPPSLADVLNQVTWCCCHCWFLETSQWSPSRPRSECHHEFLGMWWLITHETIAMVTNSLGNNWLLIYTRECLWTHGAN